MSCVTCQVSHGMYKQKGWSYSVKGLLSKGPNQFSFFYKLLKQLSVSNPKACLHSETVAESASLKFQSSRHPITPPEQNREKKAKRLLKIVESRVFSCFYCLYAYWFFYQWGCSLNGAVTNSLTHIIKHALLLNLIPSRPTNSALPNGNLEMLSRVNELELSGLFQLNNIRLSFSQKKSAQVQLV